jgi:ubiquinone/menaquinone biosynthesis C-methylase UbiE
MNEKEQLDRIERQKKGVSSFTLQDSSLVFNELNLKAGDYFLDIGCGAGDYSIQASKNVGDEGVVYALDKWDEVIEGLVKKARSQGLGNIKAIVSDITRPLPVEGSIIDVCLLATVLHIPDVAKAANILFNEIHRVLKPDGRAAIIEIKKEEMPFGPPLHVRLSPEEAEGLVDKRMFSKISYSDLGYSYMVQFKVR